MTDGLPEFLLARIAEEEHAAQEAQKLDDYVSPHADIRSAEDRRDWEVLDAFARRFSFARILAECDVNRRIVEDCKDYLLHDRNGLAGELAERTLRFRALPHVEHPEYRREWLP